MEDMLLNREREREREREKHFTDDNNAVQQGRGW